MRFGRATLFATALSSLAESCINATPWLGTTENEGEDFAVRRVLFEAGMMLDIRVFCAGASSYESSCLSQNGYERSHTTT